VRLPIVLRSNDDDLRPALDRVLCVLDHAFGRWPLEDEAVADGRAIGQYVRVAGQRVRAQIRAIGAVVGALLLSTSCAAKHESVAPVSDRDARGALNAIYALAATRTATAMKQLCEMSLDHCSGFSGSVQWEPASMPRPGKRPKILCSRDVGSGDWMLVVQGRDGLDRPYTSQVVFARDGKRVVPVREPAFWLGVGYAGTRVVGSTGWSTMYGASGNTDPAFTAKVLANARAACV